jgi:hypothetical protein
VSRSLAHRNGSSPALSASRRWILSAIALGLLYGNAMVALQPPQLEAFGIFIPHPKAVRDAFVLTAMFLTDSPKNEEYVIHGLRTQTGRAEDRGGWIRLPLTDHFPHRHGITSMHLYVPYPEAIGGEAGRQRAWALLAAKIRANHNRLHPDQPVAQVRIGSLEWPKDPRGFHAGKAPGTTMLRIWFTEAPE